MPSSKRTGSNKKGTRGNRVELSRKTVKKFTGNRFTNKYSLEYFSASSKKLKNNGQFNVSVNPLSYYCIISFSSVFGELSNIVKCKICGSDIGFKKNGEIGVGFNLMVTCKCSETFIPSCPRVVKTYEINKRLIMVLRLLGVGFNGLQLFCSLMDLTHSFSNTSYYSFIKQIEMSTKSVYKEVITKAGIEEKAETEIMESKTDLSVSGDGTWAKRGFSSLIGLVTLIGKYTGKVLDMIVKSSFCLTCIRKKNSLTPEEFEIWYDAKHSEECMQNHDGSAGKMEVDGVIEMFHRSEKLHDAKYINYIGDGDSKTFTNLLKENIYGDGSVINKLECVLNAWENVCSKDSQM